MNREIVLCTRIIRGQAAGQGNPMRSGSNGKLCLRREAMETGFQASRDVDWTGKQAIVGQFTLARSTNCAFQIQVFQVAAHLIAGPVLQRGVAGKFSAESRSSQFRQSQIVLRIERRGSIHSRHFIGKVRLVREPAQLTQG